MRTRRPTIRIFFALALLASVLGLGSYAAAQSPVPATDTVLHVFQGGRADGALPAGGVVLDAKGNLYGSTTYGGNGGSACIGGSCGTVFELSPPAQPGGAWVETILYNFTGVTHNQDGELPNGGLVMDATGNLYGVTAYGGTGGCQLLGAVDGCGSVYELSPPNAPGGTWTKTTIYSFQGGTDGDLGIGNLTFDAAGNLYGATEYGGGFGTCNAPFYQNCGTIFKLSPPKTKGGIWTEKVLYSFKGGTDGANPNGGLIFGKDGAIYGTTFFGGGVYLYGQLELGCQGAGGVGCGAVFQLEPSQAADSTWSENVLYRFQGSPEDGAAPSAGLAVDRDGNLYGTTLGGGPTGGGTLFQLVPSKVPGWPWHEIGIFRFTGASGDLPTGPVILDGQGGIYGTASADGPYSEGSIFRLSRQGTTDWNYSVLCGFPGQQAAGPTGSLTFGSDGTLYGISSVYKRNTNGAVFMLGK